RRDMAQVSPMEEPAATPDPERRSSSSGNADQGTRGVGKLPRTEAGNPVTMPARASVTAPYPRARRRWDGRRRRRRRGGGFFGGLGDLLIAAVFVLIGTVWAAIEMGL